MTQRTNSIRSLAARSVSATLLTVAALVLAGCEGTGDELSRDIGLTREAPDEFTVTTRAPLSMPPDFKIVPPQPGAPRPQERTSRDAAELALSPQSLNTSAPSNRSPGERALLGSAGPAVADPNIRDEINQQAVEDASKRSFTERLMFWKSKPEPGVVIDPTRESQRLRQNDALGQAPTAGNTPIIQPNSHSSFLDRLF